MGAQSRLLPVTIPYRFFVAASLFHVVAWGLLMAGADQVVDFSGGLGLPLAATHALTLGVLTMTAMGASFQLLPVATGQSLMALWPCRVASWMIIPGVSALIYGLATGEHHPLAAGGILSVLALILFAVLVGDVLRRTRELGLMAAYVWGAMASLLGLLALGFTVGYSVIQMLVAAAQIGGDSF